MKHILCRRGPFCRQIKAVWLTALMRTGNDDDDDHGPDLARLYHGGAGGHPDARGQYFEIEIKCLQCIVSIFFCIFYFFSSKLFPPPDADHRGAEDDQEGGDLGLARPSHAPQAHGVVTRVKGAELPDGDRDKVGGEVHGEPLLR